MRKNKIAFNKRLAMVAGAILSFIVLMMVFIAPEAAIYMGTGLAIVPIWGSIADKTFKVLTADEVAKLETSEQIQYFNDLNAHKAEELKNLKAELKTANTEQLNKQIAELRDEIKADALEQNKTILKALEEQGLAMRKLAGNAPVTRESFNEFLDKNKELLVGITKNGSSSAIVIKADTVRASVTDSKEYYAVPDIGQIATRKLNIYDLFAKIPVGDASGGNVMYYDWDEATTVRAAAVVAEGGTFPASTAKWKWYSLPLVKVGDILPVSEEFDKDMPKFAAELSQFLSINVNMAVDSQLYDGPGTGNNMTGVYTAAATYTAAASGITDASIYDLAVDVKRDITAAKGSKYLPNFILMNPTDIIKYKLKKDANNNYIMPPFASANGQIIDNMIVIENSDTTANTMLVGDNRFGKIYEVDGYKLQKGFATGDFESDMYSLKASRRLMLLVKNADKGGFRKVTSISAALTTLAS